MKKSQLKFLLKEIYVNVSGNLKGNKTRDIPINEAVSPNNQRLIEKWCKEVGNRKAAVKIIDSILRQRLGLESADLADTTTFASGIDEIEQLLTDGNYESALARAAETAKDMIEDEGGAGLFEVTGKPDESFFQRLDQALDAIEQYLDKNKAVVDDAEHPKEENSDRHGIRKAFAYGGIPYEQSREAHYKLLAFKGKLTRKYLHVTIYRMPQGSYELTRYIA